MAETKLANTLTMDAPAAKPPLERAEDANAEARLLALASALGMDPTAENQLMKPDINFVQEMAKLPVDLTETPSGADVEGMRRWVDNMFQNAELAAYRASFDIRRRCPKRKIDKSILSIKVSGSSSNSSEEFGLWIYEPRLDMGSRPTTRRPAILMFHGGGWIHGNPAADEIMAEIFASELDAVVFGVDYRLGPEHQFPAPLNDCADALDWVIQNSADYNIDTDRIALWGGSAGANLAAALTLEAPEKVAFVSLAVPAVAHPKAWYQFESNRPCPKSPNEALFLDVPPFPESMIRELEKIYDMYIGRADPCDPLVSPLMVRDLSRHPPTYITVAACDALRAQGQAYAALLRSCGVDVIEEILPGLPHSFTFPTKATAVKGWLERQVDAFARAFGQEM